MYASDVNNTLIDANQTTYKILLAHISHSAKNNDETLLQKVLLNKLINIDIKKSKKPKKIKLPKTYKEYENLFVLYMQNAARKSALNEKAQRIKQKIRTLKEEIRDTKDGKSSLLTLQLQESFYFKTKNLYEKQINFVHDNMKSIVSLLNQSAKNIDFNKVLYNQNIKEYKEESKKIKNEISKLEVEKERLEFLNDSKKKITKITNLIKYRTKEYQDTLKSMADFIFLKFSARLVKKDKKAFDTAKQILILTKKLELGKSINQEADSLLNSMEKYYLGSINVMTISTTREVQNIFVFLWSFVTNPLFNINNSPISIMKIIISILIFIFGFYIGGFYKINIKRVTQNISSINSTTRTIFSNLGYYVIIVIAFILALNVLGINLSSIGLVAGALSVGIGFGLQNIVSNFISGIILMFERSIKIGDYIELSNELRGHVTGINMRSTTINTNSNIDVIVPNQNFIQNNVINWTMNDNIRRFQIPFGVAYGTKPEKVSEVVKDAIKKSGFKDIVDNTKRHTRVIMVSMGNSSVDFELFVWIKGPETLYPKRTASRFLILVYNALYANNIEIPFPQQDLHIKSIDKDINFQASIKNL